MEPRLTSPYAEWLALRPSVDLSCNVCPARRANHYIPGPVGAFSRTVPNDRSALKHRHNKKRRSDNGVPGIVREPHQDHFDLLRLMPEAVLHLRSYSNQEIRRSVA